MTIAGVFTSIRTRLLANPTISAAVATRVYAHAPPPDATLPYILVVLSEAQDVAAMPANRATVAARLYVYAVERAQRVSDASALAAAIDAQLHNWADPPAVLASVRSQAFFDVDQTDRRSAVLAGGVYLVWGDL